MKNAYFRRVRILVMALVLAGCATPAPYTQMIPDIPPGASAFSGQTLKIGDVSGGLETNPLDVPRISNATFRQALEETLYRSGLTDGSSSVPGGTFQLSAEIVSQNVAGFFDNSITLVVHYVLQDLQTRKAVWSDNLVTQNERSVVNTFMGQERMRQLQAQAVRENLRVLVEQLKRVMSPH